MESFDFQLRTRVVFGEGSLDRIGEIARELGFTRTLIVADPGIARTTLVERAAAHLEAAGIAAFGFHDFDANPDTAMVDRGRRRAACSTWYGRRCLQSSVAKFGRRRLLSSANGANDVNEHSPYRSHSQGECVRVFG